MPRISKEDRLFKERIAGVMRELRAASGWTQAEAEEAMGVATGKVGRWERAAHAPKGYDLGRIYRAYERFGADWRWFFDPPEIVVVNPVRDRLDELSQVATTAVSMAEQKAAERARRAAARRAAAPRKRSS